MLTNHVTLEVDRSKNLFVRAKEDRCSVPTERLHFFDTSLRDSAAVLLKVFVPVAMNSRCQLHRKSVHDRRTYAVQTTASRVVLVGEFPAGMQHGQNNFKC